MSDQDTENKPIYALPTLAPASKPEVLQALRNALDRARTTEITSVSIAIHFADGGYATIEGGLGEHE